MISLFSEPHTNTDFSGEESSFFRRDLLRAWRRELRSKTFGDSDYSTADVHPHAGSQAPKTTVFKGFVACAVWSTQQEDEKTLMNL